MSTEAPAALRADACPEPELLAAYIDGQLSPGERTQLERHLAGCAECRDIVSDGVAAVAELPVAVPRRSSRTRWVGVAVALAAAAAIVIAVRLQRPAPFYLPEMDALVRVETSSRALEPRLSGGFRYAPPPIVTRGTSDTHDLELAATAEKVRTAIGDRSGPDADAARGVTFLLTGDAARGVEALERAVTSPSASPKMRSDLAAAYLQRGEPGDPERALAAAQRATEADAGLLEAQYNRALALERAGQSGSALQAWRDYAARERDTAWVAEAERHIARLSGGA